MENKSYQLRYLPIFETDLLSTVNYITNVLKNEDAAHRLVDDIESAILKRLENPLAFEPYRSAKRREYPYYRIYVRNYVVYYVVIGNGVNQLVQDAIRNQQSQRYDQYSGESPG